jgi:hypothetical protein
VRQQPITKSVGRLSYLFRPDIDIVKFAQMAAAPTATPPTKLSAAERQTALALLPGWSEVPDREALRKQFTFKSFSEAWCDCFSPEFSPLVYVYLYCYNCL